MKKLPIIMNAADHEELGIAIQVLGTLTERGLTELAALRAELARAEIVAPAEVPSDVITMNSRAELVDMDSNERMEFTLVFPREANIEEGRISVLAPLGTAMLGYHVAMNSSGLFLMGGDGCALQPFGFSRKQLCAPRRKSSAEAPRYRGEAPHGIGPWAQRPLG